MSERVKHHYHCPLDGEQLSEAYLGLLICDKCETLFLPTIGSMNNEFHLTWVKEQPPCPTRA